MRWVVHYSARPKGDRYFVETRDMRLDIGAAGQAVVVNMKVQLRWHRMPAGTSAQKHDTSVGGRHRSLILNFQDSRTFCLSPSLEAITAD